ncbi:MAG: hypothetical protein WDM91_09995 [Rhizomicrobium sp.]
MSSETKNPSGPTGLAEFLFGEFRQALQDIRQKLVEEGWFGRAVSAAPVVEMDRGPPADQLGSLGDRRPSFEEMWTPREPNARDRHERGLDIDR